MPLKVRKPKDSPVLSYDESMGGDRERAEGRKSVRRSLIVIIVAIIVIIAILIMSLIWSMGAGERELAQQAELDNQNRANIINTYAADTRMQREMIEDTKKFAEYLTVALYSADPQERERAKEATQAFTATNSPIHEMLKNMSTSPQLISPESLLPIRTDPVLRGGTKAYEGFYDYTFVIGAQDTSKDNPNEVGTVVVNPGYDVIVRFNKALSQETVEDTRTGQAFSQQKWIITDCWISPRTGRQQ